MTDSKPDTAVFAAELEKCARSLRDLLLSDQYVKRFRPADVVESTTLYVEYGGKRLRPAILLWSCGALGGKEEDALPAAAAVEIFHTWTLIHDDIIDRDERRRGGDTVHHRFRRIADKRYPEMEAKDSAHYGTSIAILAGDVQHGWCISLLTELTTRVGLPAELTLFLIESLDNEVLNLLIEGQLLDIQYTYKPLSTLSVEAIEDMLWKKTGVLYRYCAEAGATIGLGEVSTEHPEVSALVEFSSRCGLAFQLQDDLLGVSGDPALTGKPVGSDIREGKRTTVLFYSYQEADPDERALIERTLGRPEADDEEVRRVIDIMKRRGGIEMTSLRAREHIEEAIPLLDELRPGRYRDLLQSWAQFMIERSF